jgi:type I restriction enzyme M protein
MALKKSELYSSLWKGCDELRGGMDASQYKDYVLALLFIKYVSDRYAGVEDALIEVPEGGSFQDIVALTGDKEIGDKINKIIANLAAANDLKGIIDVADFNDADKLGKGKEMQDRLSHLVAIFNDPNLNFSKNRADGDDLLGDAYEYLMRNFATQSGKSKGQFYTPAEVSRIIAKVIGVNTAQSQDQTIYDPTCGSGSLLLKAADEAKRGLTIYGQEMDNATRALAKMNMILHGHPTADILQGNTLADPLFRETDGKLKRFDFAVANPPFSSKAWSNGFNPVQDEFNRFAEGIPPAKKGDYAFLLHLLKSLKSKGKGAIILPHGVLFRGNAEAEIRKNLICKGVIKGIIGLPPNLFYGTGIPACIIVFDRENAGVRQGIFMIDASKGFVKDGNKNRLRDQDLHKIVDVFNRQLEIPKYSRLVPLAEIADPKNDYNLNISRYIDSQEEEDIQDIEGHLLGGIPKRDVEALGEYWQVYPTLKQKLFEVADRPGYLNLKISIDEVKACIFDYPEFIHYGQEIEAIFEIWQAKHTPLLKAIQPGEHPKDIIYNLSEDLLQAFTGKSLIDKYDVYQHLMTYWVESMKDDVYILVEDGWKAELKEVKKNGKVTDYVCELIPKELMINRYFQAEQAEIEQLETKKDDIVRQQEELQEEHGGEEGLLEEVTNDSGKITKANVNERIKKIKNDATFADELKVLKAYLKLIDREAEISKEIKLKTQFLDKYVLTKYGSLTQDEIKSLVVDDKWMRTLQQAINSEMDRISQRLTQRIKELAERYEMPLPELTSRVDELTSRVEVHLKKMGMVW